MALKIRVKSQFCGYTSHFQTHPPCSFPFSYMEVSINGGTPKSSILTEFSLINHPFWGTPRATETSTWSQSIVARPVILSLEDVKGMARSDTRPGGVWKKYGGFRGSTNIGTPQIDGLYWNIPQQWRINRGGTPMTWWTPPYIMLVDVWSWDYGIINHKMLGSIFKQSHIK